MAVIFMGILMLVISHYLPAEANGFVKEILFSLGIVFIVVGGLCIVIPIVINKFE